MSLNFRKALVRSATYVSFIVTMFIGGILSAHAALLSFSSPNLTVIEGQTFSVDVRITNAVDLYGYQFDIGYNPLILSAVSVSEGGFLPLGGPTLWIPGIIDNTSGLIDDTAGTLQSAISGVDGTGVLASISFKALATGMSAINIFDVIGLDSQLADITIEGLQSINITVNSGGGNSVPEPTILLLLIVGLMALITRVR